MNMFPDTSLRQIKFLLEVTKGNIDQICDTILEGLTVKGLI